MKGKLLIIGLLIIAIVLFSIDLSALVEALLKTDLALFGIGTLLGFLSVIVRSVKWHLMLRKQSHSFAFARIARLYFIGIGLGTFTPGKLGDFSKALFINKKVHSLSESFSSVLLDRIVDFLVLVMLGILSAAFFFYSYGISLISLPLLLLLAAGVIAGVYIMLHKELLKKILKPFYSLLVPERFRERLRKSFGSFLSSFYSLLKDRSLLAAAFAIAIASWFFTAASYHFFALSLGLGFPFLFILLSTVLIELVSLIPVSVSGIGTRDAALIVLFSVYSASAESAVAFSLLILLSTVIIALAGLLMLSAEKAGLRELVGNEAKP